MNTTTKISNPSTATLALSDGTPVDFVKTTSKGNIQVRVPQTHPTLGSDPLRIFRPDGSHYKDATELKLVEAAAPAPAPVAEAAPAIAPKADPVPTAAKASDADADATFFVGDSTIGFATLEEAIAEAADVFTATGAVVSVEKVERKVVGRFGFVAA